MTQPAKPHIAVHYPVATHGPQSPHTIVIHDTESHDAAGIRDIEGIAHFWQMQGQGLGSHFIIDGDGNIGQGASGNNVCYAVAQHNTGYIHIELVGFAKFAPKTWILRRKQQAALKRLLAYLCCEYGIAARGGRGGIMRHMDFHDVPTGMYHSDPGKGFPFKRAVLGTRALIEAARRA